jgi:hypothetical protein
MRRANLIGHACCLAGMVLLGASPPVHATTWFALDALSAASGLGIEVDTDSLKHNTNRREVTVRVTYAQPRQHRWGAFYRSVVTTVEFRCEGGLGGLPGRRLLLGRERHGAGDDARGRPVANPRAHP